VVSGTEAPGQAPCDCCEGVDRQTPLLIDNRPGLSQVAIRAGTYAAFKASLLAALSDPTHSPMGLLTTRDDSDPTIALLDACAVVADILTFYQERLGNESYLRTACEQRSVFELARLVGYRPSPGVATTAILAVTLNDAPGAPNPATIPAGTRVQTVPDPGQNAATFETGSDLVARIEHNALPAQTTVPLDFSLVTTALWVAGTATALKQGDAVLFVDQNRTAGDSSAPWAWRSLTSVTPDAANARTLLQWTEPLTRERFALFEQFGLGGQLIPRIVSIFAAGATVSVHALRRRASLFGVNAPDPNMLPAATVPNILGYTAAPPSIFRFEKLIRPNIVTASSSRLPDWDFSAATVNADQVILDTTYTVTKGDTPASGADPGRMSWSVLSVGGSDVLGAITDTDEVSPVAFGLSAKATRLTLDNQAGLVDAIAATRATVALVQSEMLALVDQPLLAAGAVPATQPWMLAPVSGMTLTVVGGTRIVAGQPVAISGKRVRLSLNAGATAVFAPASGEPAVVPSPGDVFLLDAPADPATPNQFPVLTISGVMGTLTADPGTVTLVPADKADAVVSEVAFQAAGAPSVSGTLTTLTFVAGLTHIYDRTTVAVNANMIAATQGQTVNELLGSGDSTVAGQTFQLKQSPLTFVPSTGAQGAQSTLSVFVNDLRWTEVDNLLDTPPNIRAFVTRFTQSGSVSVRFGDGQAGARPPTGQMNIRALYRVGIGSDGMVRSGQISQAIDRPAGLRAITNPAASAGGADPDTATDARASAPLHTLTLDQVVSLTDYRDMARAFAGVAKADAIWTWFGQTRGVAVTVAGSAGAPLNNSPIPGNLTATLRAAGDPYVPVQVLACRIDTFTLAGLVRVATPTYDPTQVLPAVRAALAAAFGFDARAIGQGVAQSEVVAAIQSVPGVAAVQLTAFATPAATALAIDGDGLPVWLPAPFDPAGARGGPVPGGLLLLDPSSLANLGVWT
jgi:hypothetical protein